MEFREWKKPVNCPVCGTDSFEAFFTKYGYKFAKCAGCGLVCINPQPNDEELNDIYTEAYYTKTWGVDSDTLAAEIKINTFNERLAVVERFVKKDTLLDIGCATGFLLEAAQKRGWDTFGVEISSYSSAIARQKFGRDRIFHGTVEDAAYSDKSFDAVFMMDLIEHVKDINGFFREVRRVLKQEGVIAIVTPNVDSMSCKFMGRMWPHFKTEHLYYFSVATLKFLLNKHHFDVLAAVCASKELCLKYVARHCSSYPIPLLTPVLNSALRLLPDNLCESKFKIPTGEVFVVARKEG